MIIQFQTKYVPEAEYNLDFSRYPNNRLAFVLRSANGEPQSVLSVNVPSITLAPAEIIIKDYAENEGTLNALVSAGVVSNPHRYVQTGHVVCPICAIAPHVLAVAIHEAPEMETEPRSSTDSR